MKENCVVFIKNNIWGEGILLMTNFISWVLYSKLEQYVESDYKLVLLMHKENRTPFEHMIPVTISSVIKWWLE